MGLVSKGFKIRKIHAQDESHNTADVNEVTGCHHGAQHIIVGTIAMEGMGEVGRNNFPHKTRFPCRP